MALPTSSLLRRRQGSPLMPPLFPLPPESAAVVVARPGNHLRNGTHDPAAGTGTVIRTGAQARDIARHFVNFLLYPIYDVVHAAGSERADGDNDYSDSDENLGERTALGSRLSRRHRLRRRWKRRWRQPLRALSRHWLRSRACRFPHTGSALVAKRCSDGRRSAFVTELGGRGIRAHGHRRRQRDRNWRRRRNLGHSRLEGHRLRRRRLGCRSLESRELEVSEPGVSKPGTSQVEPGRAEAANLPPTGYRRRTSRKICRRVVLRICCRISPWSRSSCDLVRLLRREAARRACTARRTTGRSRSTKVPDQIRERPRPPTRPPPNRPSGGRRRPCKGSLVKESMKLLFKLSLTAKWPSHKGLQACLNREQAWFS